GTVEARAVFPNADGVLVPGQFVRVSVLGLTVSEAIVVPPRAVVEGPLGPSVFVVGEKSIARMRPVKLGATTGQGQVVTEGLEPGERVVVGGIGSIRPGIEVREGDPDAAGEAAATEGKPGGERWSPASSSTGRSSRRSCRTRACSPGSRRCKRRRSSR